MATTPRDRLDREKRKIEVLAADPDARMTASDREALLEYADALDDQKVRHKYRDADGNVKTLKPRTIDRYLSNLRICVEAGFDLLDTTADEFNDFMDHFHDDVGKSKATLATYQAAGESFHRYHDDLGVKTEAIEYFTPDTTPKHDEMDMFTEEEVQALRQACGETKWVHRNRALLELLIFTGQRISALVTLRIGDVDVQEGYIYLNDTFEAENGGLKGPFSVDGSAQCSVPESTSAIGLNITRTAMIRTLGCSLATRTTGRPILTTTGRTSPLIMSCGASARMPASINR